MFFCDFMALFWIALSVAIVLERVSAEAQTELRLSTEGINNIRYLRGEKSIYNDLLLFKKNYQDFTTASIKFNGLYHLFILHAVTDAVV